MTIKPAKEVPAAIWAPLIFCATLIAYLPALRGGLLWDDSSHITRPDLQSLHGIWRIWFQLGATQQYYPLLHTAFWVEHRLWSDAVLGYHLTNVLLHALSACLVVLIVRRLSIPGAWLAGLLFALHPVCVESVAWISEQKSTLSGLFYLAAALVYLSFDQARRPSRYVLAFALFVLALLTKTVTATLPASLLVILWWQRGRLEWKRDIAPLVPWLAVGAFAGLFTVWVERTYIGAQGASFSLTFLQRILLAGRALCFYAAKLAVPVNLTFFYPHWNLDPAAWWQFLFPTTVLAVAIGLAWLAKRDRGPLAAFLIFAATLFPVLGFFNVYPFRYSYVADHFQYLAILAILVPTAALLVRIPAAQFILPAVLLGMTWPQAATYRDAETLYRATLDRNPDSWLAHNNLGNLLLPGRRDEAIAQFEAALRVKPDYSEAHLSLGNALQPLPGRLNDAIAEYRKAAAYDPTSERAQNNLGYALLLAGRRQEAIAALQNALRLRPGYAEAHTNLGNVWSVTPDRLPDAIAEYQAAIRAEPAFPEAHNNLGRCLAQLPGRLPEAVAEFATAIRLRPDYWSAHNNLGNALSEMPGRLNDAITEYREAVRIAPNAANSHYNLGNALSQIPARLPEAAAEYQATLRIEPDNMNAHYRLGGVLAQIPSRKADAIAELEIVLRAHPNPGLQRVVDQLRNRQ